MTRPVQYTERVDAVIYSPPTAGFTCADWLELALASLDQAGLPARTQEEFRNYLIEWRTLNDRA